MAGVGRTRACAYPAGTLPAVTPLHRACTHAAGSC